MSINKTYAVFGLGRYGRAVAEELVKNGADVIAVDRNEELVNDAAQFIPVCKCADITDPETIKRLGISNIDVVIVDPPRKGLDNKTIDNLIRIKPRKIVYVSCNPATLVRDLQMLENAYNLKQIKNLIPL